MFAAMCAASFAIGSFVFGEGSAPAPKKLPLKPVALAREVTEEPLAPATLAPIVQIGRAHV